MATPPHVPPKPQDPRQSQTQQPVTGAPRQAQPQPHQDDDKAKAAQHEREEREAREKHEREARDKEGEEHKRGEHDQKGKKKPPLLAEGQAHQLFFNGHKIAKEGDPPHQWLSMGRLPNGEPVVQTPMTPDLEKKLKEGKFYLAEGVTEEDRPIDPQGPGRHDPL